MDAKSLAVRIYEDFRTGLPRTYTKDQILSAMYFTDDMCKFMSQTNNCVVLAGMKPFLNYLTEILKKVS